MSQRGNKKATAQDRMKRLLAMVPWIVANPGVRLSELAERFGLTEAELAEDIDVVFMVGLPPYTPDALIDFTFDEDRIWIRYADFFARPLKLTPAQALALLASSDGLMSVPGSDPDGPLARALDKLGSALGVDVDATVDVHLGSAAPENLALLRTAVAEKTDVDIVYYSHGRDERSARRISPWRLNAAGGYWYVQSWCHRAEGERLFRVDRIESVTATGEASSHPAPVEDAEAVMFRAAEAHDSITLRLDSEARWVAETYPYESVDHHDDGSVTVTLRVSGRPWLERLLVRLGPLATVVDAADVAEAKEIGPAAALRMLQRYEG